MASGGVRLHLDCETFSCADIRRAGAHQYARHASTALLMVGYQADDDVLGLGPVGLWDAVSGDPMPKELRELLDDNSITLMAFNANFEMAVFDAVGLLPFAPSRWLCVQALALSYGLPASLGGVCDALGFTGKYAKLAEGQRLIRKFSIPQPKDGRRIQPQDDPEAWKRFCAYCQRDVVAEREIVRRLSS
jgi:DNA polymerase